MADGRPRWVKMISLAPILGWWAIVAQEGEPHIVYRRWALTHRGARRKLRRLAPAELRTRGSDAEVGVR